MNTNALVSATLIGALLQLAMVITGHFVPFVRIDVFALGGMAISLVAGFIYGWQTAGAWMGRTLGGAVAGGVCALIGIVVSVLLGDTAALILVVGTVSSAVTGAIGGALSKLAR